MFKLHERSGCHKYAVILTTHSPIEQCADLTTISTLLDFYYLSNHLPVDIRQSSRQVKSPLTMRAGFRSGKGKAQSITMPKLSCS